MFVGVAYNHYSSLVGLDSLSGNTTFAEKLKCQADNGRFIPPSFPAFAPSTYSIYITCGPNLLELNSHTGTMMDYYLVGGTPSAPLISPDESRLYMFDGKCHSGVRYEAVAEVVVC